jgi:hypothetical protein
LSREKKTEKKEVQKTQPWCPGCRLLFSLETVEEYEHVTFAEKKNSCAHTPVNTHACTHTKIVNASHQQQQHTSFHRFQCKCRDLQLRKEAEERCLSKDERRKNAVNYVVCVRACARVR